MTRIAIIDMGTNTFHLLVAESDVAGYKAISRTHIAVKLGLAGINEGIISEAAFARATEAMQKFKTKIEEYGVATVYAFGTSAMRHAKNGPALAEKILSLTGIKVRIISGEQEADLIYEGVRSALDMGDEINLVMDIGAGSVEFIIADKHQVFWKQSFEMGGQRLLEKFQEHDPISSQEITTLDTFFETTLPPLFQALNKFRPAVLIGSSGSFDTLSDLFCMRKGIARTSSYDSEIPLSKDGFYAIYHELIIRNRNERMQMPGMIEMRVDMIVVACCLIRFVLENHEFERIRVSTYSLKEGVLACLTQGKQEF